MTKNKQFMNKKNTFSLLIIKLKSINFNCLLEFGEAQSCGVKTVPHIWMQKNIQISEKYPNIQLEGERRISWDNIWQGQDQH